ncbi:hypothetical protein LOTGIDRAFT_229235 [Lottia gigantea]|uniref:Snake toxin/toxin-like domain-containing protein n=1 Tax=Lottia gigantea TaxID=225164 RepID=V3ZWN9_LOTGI|nr:hypothetical protein LOTGIDRAFT_229235 [Lottia gigantea]ESO87030.1 hypothetical protein LOTGIDRAFT_229235 [Lottia gigantea]
MKAGQSKTEWNSKTCGALSFNYVKNIMSWFVNIVVCLTLLLPVKSAVTTLDDAGKNLTCYSCFTRNERGACVTNATTADIILCSPENTYCRVFLQQTQGVFVSLERGCASSCRKGCGTWGDDIDHDECYSCCRTDLCNTGNTGLRTRLSFYSLINSFFLVASTICVRM